VGYLVAPAALSKAVSKLQGHSSGNVCTFAQYGALAALDLPVEMHDAWRRTLRENRDQAFDWVSRHFVCEKPAGAFYVFPDISGRLKPGETAEAFASRLLQETGVAVVPGEAFGADRHLRISYAVSSDILAQGLARLEKAL
jgi:aspartate aminotransferase